MHIRIKSVVIVRGKTTYIFGSEGKEYACNVGGLGWIPGSGRSSGEGNGNPLQYPHLENLMDRGAWQVTAHGIT